MAQRRTSKGTKASNTKAREIRVLFFMNASEKADLERLVRLRQADVADEGLSPNTQDVLRWLVARELKARAAREAP